MKKLVLISIISIFLYGCSSTERENNTIKWIKEHPKPIYTQKFSWNSNGYIQYTLVDSSNEYYNTGFIDLALKDTIK